jgi:hypothetical protein
MVAFDFRRLYADLHESSQAELDPAWRETRQGCFLATVLPKPSGVESPQAATDLNNLPVSQNPSTGVTWIRLTGSAKEPHKIVVRDTDGRARSEVSLSPASADGGRTMLDLHHPTAGVCFLETAGERRSCKLVLASPGGAP